MIQRNLFSSSFSFSTTIETDEDILEVEVEGNFIPGETEVHTYSNGDPGHPGSGPDVEILRIMCDGLDMTETISSTNMDILTEEAFEYLANYDKNDY
jgi:hypothetical protein